jgi:dTMP kinase
MSKGFFIVIDGPDGSGKGTQARFLYERLKKEGRKVELVDFPRYGQPSAFFVEKYLNGEYGSNGEVDPKLGSLFYALDRFDASKDMKEKLSNGCVLISNRYVSSNMAHQGGKIQDKDERIKFIKWVEELEYDINKIPQPDKVIYLHVPVSKSQELIDKKEERSYIKNGSKDIHELDLNHLNDSQKTYLELIEMYPNYTKIICTDNSGEMRTVEDINDDIYKLLD